MMVVNTMCFANTIQHLTVDLIYESNPVSHAEHSYHAHLSRTVQLAQDVLHTRQQSGLHYQLQVYESNHA